MERTILSLAGTSCSNTDLLVENPSSLAVVVVFWYYIILRFVLETSGPLISKLYNTQLLLLAFLPFACWCFWPLLQKPFTVLYILSVSEFRQMPPGVSKFPYLSSTGPNPLTVAGCWISVATGLAWEKNSAVFPLTFCCLCLHCACLHIWAEGFCTRVWTGTLSHPCWQRVNSLPNSPARRGLRRDCSIIP